MMYDEQLETLIDAAFSDGKLTDKERHIIYKRAQAQGIDLEELELILDARLQKINNSTQAKVSFKSEKIGELRKCPSCGATIGSFRMICPECGYEFTGIGPNNFVKDFADKLNETISVASKSVNMNGFHRLLDTNGTEEERRRDSAISHAESQFVKNYPLPLTKEDSIEILNYMIPKIQSSGATGATLAWREKYESILSRLENQCQRDPDMQVLVLDFKNKLSVGFLGHFHIWWKSLSRIARVSLSVILLYALFGIGMTLLFINID